jgi:hypothetical protein
MGKLGIEWVDGEPDEDLRLLARQLIDGMRVSGSPIVVSVTPRGDGIIYVFGDPESGYTVGGPMTFAKALEEAKRARHWPLDEEEDNVLGDIPHRFADALAAAVAKAMEGRDVGGVR